MTCRHDVVVCRVVVSQNYAVTSSWRRRHVAMTPLFVETQTLQTNADGSDDAADGLTGEVRATQQGAVEFTATVDTPGTYRRRRACRRRFVVSAEP